MARVYDGCGKQVTSCMLNGGHLEGRRGEWKFWSKFGNVDCI